MKRFAVLILLGLWLSACQSIPPTLTPPAATATPRPPETALPTPAASPTPTPGPSSARLPAPVTGGRAMLGLVGQPQTLNPILQQNNPALRALTPLLFDTLLRVDPATAQLQPGLAQSWEYSQNGRQVTFRLPPNLKWSDGSPLAAADIAQSLQATQHPALLSFSQIDAPDMQTLSLTFLEIDCAAVTTLAQLPLLPASQITQSVPPGSGPFMPAQPWATNQQMLALIRNPNYHGSAPFLDGLTVRFIDKDQISVALSEGQFDAVGPLPAGLPLPGNMTNLPYPAPQVVYLAINFDPRNEAPVLPAVRRALLQALDRPAILAETLGGDGQLMAGSLLPEHWAANPSLSPPPYNPEAARSLLAQAGLSDTDGDGWLDQNSQRIELDIRLNGQNDLYRRLGWLVSSYYRDLGLFARAQSVPPDSIIDDLFTHDFRLAIFSWPILPDPDQRLYWHATENAEGEGLNFTSYSNPQLDALLEQGVAVPGCPTQERAPLYNRVQEILSRERPVDFLLAPNRHVLVANRLAGLNPGPFAPFTWNVSEWHLQ